MTTVMLTTNCPNSCEWCFARTKMKEYRARGIDEMSWDNFLAVVSFYEESGLNHMILLGGEPTLHSRLEDMLDLLVSRHFTAIVVTNGRCDRALVDKLAEKKYPGVRFAVNTTSYFRYPEDARASVDYFLSRLGHSVSLSYTVTAHDLREESFNPLLDRIGMIINFGLARHIQFQIAVPAMENTCYVPFEDYGAVLRLLGRWSKILLKNGISTGLDCHSVPKCFLGDVENPQFALRSRCEDFMIDIGPDLEIWPCFPLSGQNVKLTRFKNFSEARGWFRNIDSETPLLYEPQCMECEERAAGECDAGCRGFQILRRRALKKASAAVHPAGKGAFRTAAELQ